MCFIVSLIAIFSTLLFGARGDKGCIIFGTNQNTCLSTVSGEAVGKSSLVPVPYDWILKDPSSVVVYGLPDGVTLRKPSEYDTKTLMKILEQSNRIRFIVKRSSSTLFL